jgi:hypothetical protein
MAPKVFSRVTGPVNSALGLVENTGSTVLNTGKGVWRSLGNGSRRVVRSVGSRGNNAIRRLVTGKGGRRNRKMNKTRKNRKNRK